MADRFGTLVEKLGFAGIWATDSMGRGRHTLDPFVTLSALHAGTSRIELGIGVLQVPLRRPGELAHRIQSLNVLLAGRLRLGVGADPLAPTSRSPVRITTNASRRSGKASTRCARCGAENA